MDVASEPSSFAPVEYCGWIPILIENENYRQGPHFNKEKNGLDSHFYQEIRIVGQIPNFWRNRLDFCL